MSIILTKEPMSYKDNKRLSELVTKLRLIRRVKIDNCTHLETANSFQCHRNTVGKLVGIFETKIRLADQKDGLMDISRWFFS